MEIRLLRSNLIALVHHHRIPIIKLINAKYLQALATQYKFSSVDPAQDPIGGFQAVQFSNGLYQPHDEIEFVISRLGVEARKIVLALEGPSNHLHSLFEEVIEYLTKLAGADDPSFLTPVLLTEESEIISHLDIPFEKLISDKLYPFINEKAVPRAETEAVKANIGSISINFKIDYLPKDSMLNDRRITMVRKELAIESTTGHLLEEQIYSSKAPFDTETHLEILTELESIFNR